MRLDLEAADDIAALVRAARAESLVVAIAPSRDSLALAQARAAIGPLAIERAPATRVNAVLWSQGANPTDIAAAIAFLERARSTTGQILEIS